MGFLFNRQLRSDLPAPPNPSHDFWYSVIASLNTEISNGIAVAYACKLAIAESVAMLPAVVMEEDGESKKASKDKYLYKLIKDQPNSYMGSFDFFESQQNSLLEHGNSFSFLARNKRNEIREIRPLDATKMTVEPQSNGTLGYIYRDGNTEKRYSQSDILHVRYNSRDGINGRAPSDVCKTAFAYAQFLEQHGKNVFEKGGFMAGFLQVPPEKKFKDEEVKKSFLESFKKGLMGSLNTGSIGMLESGMTFQPYSGSNKEQQFLELSDFAVKNIARIYRVPPVMIAVTESGMSYASIEQLAIMWVQYTIQPWVTRWERAFQWQVFGAGNPNYLKFNLKALLRGDYKSEIEAIVKQIEFGLLTINEGRKLTDTNPSGDELADKLLVSHNILQGVINGQDQTDSTD